MQSSTSHSNYGKCPASDFQYRPASRSIYETEHRLFATLSSTHYFFGPESPTTFNLFLKGNLVYRTVTFDTYSSPGRYQTQAFGYERGTNDDSAHLFIHSKRYKRSSCVGYHVLLQILQLLVK